MDEPTDPGPNRQTTCQEPAACPCGNADHDPIRIGERLSPTGASLGGVYVCPAESASGLRGVL